jgi:predicted TIM-barrel fold metal-dependent hydrolase
MFSFKTKMNKNISNMNVYLLFSNQIQRYFPSLSSWSNQVITTSILNKIIYGVDYSKEMEEIIYQIYPIIIDSIKEDHKNLI